MAFSGTFYGFRPVGSLLGVSDVILEFNGGGTFAKYDLLTFDGSGELVISDAGDPENIGVALEAATASSTGVQVNVTPFLMVIADNDNVGTTFAATHVGEYADAIGATGEMGIDTSSHSDTTEATLFCLEYNPKGFGVDSDTSIGKYVLYEHVFN
jgi:hypothetical protein